MTEPTTDQSMRPIRLAPFSKQNLLGVDSIPVKFRKFIRMDNSPEGVFGQCWTWIGFSYKGYGRAKWPGIKTEKAHRVMYQLLVGPIEPGLELDHLCHNSLCVNPDHLEPVTRAENIRRSHVNGRGNGTKTHCKYGHEFTPENTYNYPGNGHFHPQRFCRECLKRFGFTRRKASR